MTGALAALGGSLNPTLQLIASEYLTTVEGGGEAWAGFGLLTTGIAAGNETVVSGDDYYPWLVDDVASNYEARATLTSGTFTTGTAATWLPLSSNVNWQVSKASTGSKSATADFEIRRASDAVVVAGPVSITMTAQVTA
jgi:hypothetical protein